MPMGKNKSEVYLAFTGCAGAGDKTHRWDPMSSNVKQGVSVSSAWSGREMLGSASGEMSVDLCGHDGLSGAERLGHGRKCTNWVEPSKA